MDVRGIAEPWSPAEVLSHAQEMDVDSISCSLAKQAAEASCGAKSLDAPSKTLEQLLVSCSIQNTAVVAR
eukprot:2886025-Rhodomonas_salina.1